MSTNSAPTAAFDVDRAWALHPQVSVRPERFGALLYHFGTRRLSFLKSAQLHDVVAALDSSSSAREAMTLSGVGGADVARYEQALAGLAATDMIRERSSS